MENNMNIETIFTIKNEHLSRLDQNSAVEFFQKLLWAEARRLGVEISKVNVSRWINVPDGGVDANVDDAKFEVGQGLITKGKTSYQIKAGDTFKPWQNSVIKKELFGTKTPERQNLGGSIKTCLDAEGTYILVCTGIDPTEYQRINIHSHIEEYLKLCGYSHPKFEVFTQNNLIGFLELFPSLVLWVKRYSDVIFQTHQSWADDATMQGPFVSGQPQNELIQIIQNELRRDDYPIHVRIWGEPGIGKTRLVLEATRTDDLTPLVIYFRSSSQFSSGILMNEIRFNENLAAIVVIDECEPDSRARVWRELKHYSPRIKLITLYNDYEEIPGDISYHFTPPLEEELIQNIIQEYKIPPDHANRWVELCDGSPRVAHVIGWNLVNHPEDVLKPPSTVNIWERYIAAGDAIQSEKTEQRRLVLQYLALFKRFGYENPVDDEAKAIARMIKEANPHITWDRFQEIIYELRKRKILQGEFTLYITPKALHIKLWTQWWEVRGSGFHFDTFCKNLPSKLIEWFYEMFQYAAESDAASRIVKDLLGPDGPFQNDEYLNTRLGSRFFSALTESNPKYALRHLVRTIGKQDKDTLMQLTEGRRYVVWALEKIAMHRDMFADAARLLLALGEAENEGCSNNASGVFAELFSPGPGRVAPTEASPAERLPILKEAFESNSKERRSLALKACNTALQSGHFSRRIGAEYQGLRIGFNLWEPKTYGELWDAYRQVWELLSKQLSKLPEDGRNEAVGILLGRAGSLGRIPDLGVLIVNTIRTIIENKYASEKQIIETISKILFHDDSYRANKGLPAEIRQSFEKLRDDLIGSDYHSLMQRYVGMDLVEDLLIEDRDGVNQIQPHLEKLARQSIEHSSLFLPELPWLVTTEAKNGYRFGHTLGKIDIDYYLLPALLDAQRKTTDNASVTFLSGYFSAIYESNLVKWEEQLEELVEDKILNLHIPDIACRSGLTDGIGMHILELAKRGILNIKHFAIFVYGKVVESLSNEVFTAWIEYLLTIHEKFAVSTALTLYYRYYYQSEKTKPNLPCDLTFKILTHPIFFEELEEYQYDIMTDHYWLEIANAFLTLYPEYSLELAKLILIHYGSEGTIVGGFEPNATLILAHIAKQHPEQMCELVCKQLDTQNDFSRKLSLERWIREGDISKTEKEKGALTLFPRDKIWEWVDDDVENRAWYLARSLAPTTLSKEEWLTSLPRAILKRYGTRDDVRRSLISNYSTGVWAGQASSRYETIKQKMLEFKCEENNENVVRWICEYIEELDNYIEHAKIEEEREF